jgi:hypothetical protein
LYNITRSLLGAVWRKEMQRACKTTFSASSISV